jgi:type I restriction enzyme M protein
MNWRNEMLNFNEKINLIWQIAETLRGIYKPEKYGDVILPMCVIRRFDCILEEKKDEIMKIYEEYKSIPEESLEEIMLAEIEARLGIDQKFYNISPFTLEKLMNDSENIKENFEEYINGFSDNVRDIIQHFDLKKEIEKLSKNNALYSTLKELVKVDFHPDVVSNMEMGYIFEDLIRRFSENGEAGDHYTPREVIELCMEMLFYGREETIEQKGKILSVADFCAGTGGMLSLAERYIKKKNPTADVQLFGQEINDQSYAICKSDMLIKGQNPENIVLGNTLDNDGHSGKQYRYLISNPPFGVQWKKEEAKVKEESEKLGFDGRFGAGTPRVSDGSLLFLQNMMSKMYKDEEGSRVAIIFNGSPLFTGDAGSGESNIRKWIIENDMLEGVIAMPTDLFYNTGISTYVWVITNRKSQDRQGKIQLVNAVDFYKPMRKSLGNKRKEITKGQIKEIRKIYAEFSEGEYCRIFDNEDFGFRKITVERPLKLKFQVTSEKIEELKNQSQFVNLAVSKKKKEELKEQEEAEGRKQQDKLIDMLQSFSSDEIFMSRDKFLKALKKKIKEYDLDFVKGALLKAVLQTIGERDEDAEVCKDSKGNIEADTSQRDTETIPLKDSIEVYFQREVVPHVPDAWMDESSFDKIGYEIPFTRHFYKYEELRSFEEIMSEVKALEEEIQEDIRAVLG